MAECPYSECDGSGMVIDLDAEIARPCTCRPQKVARAQAKALEGVIPKRFRDASFDRPPVSDMPDRLVSVVRRFSEDIESRLDRGDGLWFVGDIGTGKTTLAMLVSKAALQAGRSVAIFSMPRLLARIRRTYDAGASLSDIELIDRLAAVDLLHIDDLGTSDRTRRDEDGHLERSSDWMLEQVYTVVNARWEEQRSIVATTSVTDREELCAQIGERSVSRLTEMCDEIPVFGEDRRLEFRA